MVLSDDTGPGPGKGRRSRVGPGLVVVALIGLLAGFLALGGLTRPAPEALQPTTTTITPTTTLAPTTTTQVDPETFSVEDIARGEPFDWEMIMAIDEGYATAMLEHDDRLFLFSTTPAVDQWALGGGLTTWSSDDGTNWTSLGQVIGPEYQVSRVVSTDRGLVALGTGETKGSFTLWRSEDGASWDREQVEVEGVGAAMTVWPYDLVTTGDVSLIALTTTFDVTDRLTETLGTPIDMEHFTWDPQVLGDDITFTLTGPFGVPLATRSADEIGLTPTETEMVIRSYSESTVEILRSTDGESWEPIAIPDTAWIDGIYAIPGKRLLAHGFSSTGNQVWTSPDGLEWEAQPSWEYPYTVDTWGELLVGPSYDGRASVVVSANGSTWQDMGLSQQFPKPIQWSIGEVGSGVGGVAAHVVGQGEARGVPMTPDPMTIADVNGTEVTLDFGSGVIEVDTAEGPYRWSMYSMTPEGFQVDLKTGMASLINRQTGETLATLSLEDLEDVEEDYWADNPVPLTDRFDALAFTDDGSNWSIQDFGALATGSYFSVLDVSDTRVTAVRVSEGNGEPSFQGFELWSALIP